MMRLSRKIEKALLLALCCLPMLKAWAQQGYKYRAALQKPAKTGFYKILLKPELIAKTNPDQSDLRLTDSTGKFVSYIRTLNPVETGAENFTSFTEIRSVPEKDTGTRFIVQNIVKHPISQLWIRLKNTAVERTMNLMGSDNLAQWFAIEENIPLAQAQLTDSGNYEQALKFPVSNYKYFKIMVDDKHKTPVKFLSAGVYTGRHIAPPIIYPILPVRFVQHEQGTQSVITVTLNDKYQIDELGLTATGPKYFKRNVTVFSGVIQSPVLETDGEIVSGTSVLLSSFSARTKQLTVHIENEDNPPLKITGVQVYQREIYMISYLDAMKQYYLLAGDPKAIMPDYDLKYFSDSVRGATPALNYGAININPAYGHQYKNPKKNNSLIMWGIILAALCLLSLLTWKMAGEVGKRA